MVLSIQWSSLQLWILSEQFWIRFNLSQLFSKTVLLLLYADNMIIMSNYCQGIDALKHSLPQNLIEKIWVFSLLFSKIEVDARRVSSFSTEVHSWHSFLGWLHRWQIHINSDKIQCKIRNLLWQSSSRSDLISSVNDILVYLATPRLDISFVVHSINQFAAALTTIYWAL